MKLEIKKIDGVPVTGIPDGSRTVLPEDIMNVCENQLNQLALFSYLQQLRDYLIQDEKSHPGKDCCARITVIDPRFI